MNIKNFESVVDKTILQRGLGYYKSGSIESLDFDGDEWTAEVSGSDDYTVTVSRTGKSNRNYCSGLLKKIKI